MFTPQSVSSTAGVALVRFIAAAEMTFFVLVCFLCSV